MLMIGHHQHFIMNSPSSFFIYIHYSRSSSYISTPTELNLFITNTKTMYANKINDPTCKLWWAMLNHNLHQLRASLPTYPSASLLMCSLHKMKKQVNTNKYNTEAHLFQVLYCEKLINKVSKKYYMQIK
jgi:hypothetical protein